MVSCLPKRLLVLSSSRTSGRSSSPLASACQPLAWSADGCTPALCNAMALHKGKECTAKTTLSHANCLPEYKATRANIYDNDFYLRKFDNSQIEKTRVALLYFFISSPNPLIPNVNLLKHLPDGEQCNDQQPQMVDMWQPPSLPPLALPCYPNLFTFLDLNQWFYGI